MAEVMEKIDFVLTWVDGSDPEWIAEKQKWEKGDCFESVSSAEDANGSFRYRADDELLRYWFRSAEQFAPWVNRIHFVTCGQKPDWLDEHHPKLDLVVHSDYIPSRFLPTFNSNAIELNYHRMTDLAEKFVLFNDDMFLLQPISSEFFFRDGCPVIEADLRYAERVGFNNWSRVLFNDYCIVNRSFDIEKSLWTNKRKWFSISALGLKRVRKNFLCYWTNRTLPVSTFGHVPSAHLKSTLEEIWEKHPEVMENTCSHKFRSDDQVNQWLAIAWNLAKGCFYPANGKTRGGIFNISSRNIYEVEAAIKGQLYPQICLNDSERNDDPEKCSQIIMAAFGKILPEKSSFEKY